MTMYARRSLHPDGPGWNSVIRPPPEVSPVEPPQYRNTLRLKDLLPLPRMSYPSLPEKAKNYSERCKVIREEGVARILERGWRKMVAGRLEKKLACRKMTSYLKSQLKYHYRNRTVHLAVATCPPLTEFWTPCTATWIPFSAIALLSCCHTLTALSPTTMEKLGRFSLLPFETVATRHRNNLPLSLRIVNNCHRNRSMALKAASGSVPSADKSNVSKEEEKSETYSHNMTEAMGAVLTYRHELGMNYNFIRPDLIVGSCPQTPDDVEKLRRIGVKTIFCLQQNPDLEYPNQFAIQEYAKAHDVQHLRAEIRDFDAFDLRMRLPAVVSKLYKAINSNGGVTYIHCTAGLGRAPAVAAVHLTFPTPRFHNSGSLRHRTTPFITAYMFWVLGYTFKEAHTLLQSKRECFPKLDAIKSATADILTGLSKKPVTLSWEDSSCSRVEISGLDIGWGQRVPLDFDDKSGLWYLERELPIDEKQVYCPIYQEGRYEYKYIVDGEWTCNKDELVTAPNKDGHVNNFIQVLDNSSSGRVSLRERFSSDDPDLTPEERLRIKEFLEACPDEDL
ncbi:hypothetical protein V8G54_029833 [Vigna mungo]|uniref:Tyrosine specific protein phosphatases domain-containing protein n=1 Tax=Vigna mungo TaxID=3915 RepID=A0AAQ3MUI3_VIGMU